jgi:hypothetical protein
MLAAVPLAARAGFEVTHVRPAAGSAARLAVDGNYGKQNRAGNTTPEGQHGDDCNQHCPASLI